MRHAVRLHRAVLAAALVVPAAMFGAAAWWNRAEVLREGAGAVERTAAVMHEHAAKVFDTADLVLARVDERIARMGEAEVASPETSEFLHALKQPLDQFVSIWVTDADGRVQAGSQPWNPGVTIADRDFFRVPRERAGAGSYVSEAFTGRVTTVSSFAISRRRSHPGNRFVGTLHVALSPDYFEQFFLEAAPVSPHAAGLFRADGALLAREPRLPGQERLPDASPVLRRIAEHPERGVLSDISASEQVERLYAYRKVGRWPVYVSFGADADALLARWRENLVVYGTVAAAAAATLLAVAWLALRRTKVAEAAQAALRREAAARAAAEAREAAEARFRGVFESRVVGFSVLDLASARTLVINDRLLQMTGTTRTDFEAGRYDWRRIAAPEHRAADERALEQARARGWWDPYEKEYLRRDGSRLPVRSSSAPLPGEPGRLVVLVQDISEQREAEMRRDLLMREVDHRAKNALATARAALRLTRATTVADFVREVDGRIGALAQAIALLSTTHWQGADLEALRRGELAPFIAGEERRGEPRAQLRGPATTVRADAVQPLAMAVHELATNATKYGALAAPSGVLDLSWELTGSPPEHLALRWRERGGPTVAAAPPESGFGTRVLRSTVTRQLGGTLEQRWDPAGLCCEMSFPAARVLAPPPDQPAA